MSLIFNTPFWDVYDPFDRDFFNDFKVSPRNRIGGKSNGEETSLFKPFTDSVFKTDIIPPVDLTDKDDHYEMRVAVPGASPDEIKLDFDEENNEITVSGEIPEHKTENEEEGKSYKEFRSGSFERKVRFGKGVELDSEHIEAGLKNGILNVSIPKVVKPEKKNVKRIEVSKN